jgi:hypothetical protein
LKRNYIWGAREQIKLDTTGLQKEPRGGHTVSEANGRTTFNFEGGGELKARK